MNFYLITFDRNPRMSYKNFHDTFVSHPEIKSWWHYIKSCYIVKTELEADELSEHFRKSMQTYNLKATHLTLGIDLDDRQGWLPKDAWPWLKKNTNNQH